MVIGSRLIVFSGATIAVRDIDTDDLPHQLPNNGLGVPLGQGLSLPQGTPEVATIALDTRTIPLDSTPPDYILRIPSPMKVDPAADGEREGSSQLKLILPAPWYLQSPRLPLRFDVIHGKHTEAEGLKGIRYQLVDMPGSDAPFGVQMISRFRFPQFRASLDASQIPGYFTVGASPLPKYENREGRDPNERDHYTTFVYEPPSEDGEDFKEDLSSLMAGKVDGGIDGEGEANAKFRPVRLSSLYKGSLLNINCCVSGICAYRALFHGAPDGPWGTCLVRYPPES